jgi:hypothetical protein
MATQQQRQQEIAEEIADALDRQRLKTLEDKVDSLIKDRDSALKWGVITLGAAVLGLVTWIFNLVRQVP